MRLKNSTWFECKVRYDKMQETGLQKKVTDLYVVEALSFTEAEAAIIEEMMPYISGEFEITGIKPAAYHDVCFMSEAAKWFHNEVDEMKRALQKGDRQKADEVFHRPLDQQNNTDTMFFKAKIQFITLDEKSGKEKRTPMTYLVQATSLDNAVQNIGVAMQGTMIDYAKSSVVETKILDVFEHRTVEETPD